MRASFLFLAASLLAFAQTHHPSWWNDASPGATALIGVEWQTVRLSPFAEAVEAELWGDLGFPDLPCLHRARQIVISSPDFLALVSGACPALAAEASAFNPMTYRGVEMYFAKQKGVLSVARINDQLLMLGEPKTLEMAVDRQLKNTRDHSPLLARAGGFNGKDLWIVASHLPDDLANRFVPLEVTAERFEGAVSVRNGLELDVELSAPSEKDAQATADKLIKDSATFPSILRGIEIASEADSVKIKLTATREQVLASMRAPEPEKKAVETVKVETPKQVEFVPVDPPKPIPAISAKVVEKAPEKPVEKPQIVRIVGLDEGPKEFVLPPAAKPDPQPHP